MLQRKYYVTLYIYLFLRRGNFDDRNLQSVINILDNKKGTYEKQDISIYINNDPIIVLILTLIMKRSHEQEL